MYRIHSAAAVCTPLFVLLMRRFALACRTLRAQSQFFASQKTLVWLGFLFLSKPVAYILLPQCALRFFVLLMRRSAPACRTLRAQSQFFASQKTLVWLGFLFLSKPVAYILLPQCALRFFVLLMRRSASACRTLRAQSQFFASQKIALVEMRRIELLTPCLQGRCSPS